MLISFPPLPKGFAAIGPFIDTIRRSFLPLVSKDEAVDHVLLLSPGGLTYTVTVDDAGTLVTALNDGKTRP